MLGEVLGVERRRRWSEDEKLEILSEVGVGGVSVTQVAQRHEITRSQIYGWRRDLKKKNRAFNGYYFRPSWMIKHGFGLVKEWSVALLKGSSPRTDVLTPKSTTTRTVEVSDETEAVEEMVLSD